MKRYLHQRLGRILTLYLDVHHLRPVSLQYSDKNFKRDAFIRVFCATELFLAALAFNQPEASGSQWKKIPVQQKYRKLTVAAHCASVI